MGQIQICWSFIQQWIFYEQFQWLCMLSLNIFGKYLWIFIEFFANILLVCWWISVLLFICTKKCLACKNFVWFGKAAHDLRIIFHIFLLSHPFITEKEKNILLSLGWYIFLHILHIWIIFHFSALSMQGLWAKAIQNNIKKLILRF